MDKIKIYHDDNQIIPQSIINNNFLHTIARKESRRRRLRITYTCNHPVSLSVDGFGTYIEFNPTTLIRGNNLVQITRCELEEAIQMVEEMLSINTSDWKLTGLDFNQNIETQYAPSGYLPIFRSLAAYTKQTYADGNSIAFYNKTRCLRFYDKIQQAQAAGLVFDAQAYAQYLLRIELGIGGRLQKLKTFSEVTSLHQLVDLDTYVHVVDEWERMYGKIQKQSLQRFKSLVRPLDMDLKEFAVLEFINSNGLESVLDAIDCDVCQKRLHYQTGYTRKARYREVWANYLQRRQDHHDLLSEVDQKVKDAAEQCRQAA